VQELFGVEDTRMFIYSEMMWNGKKVLKAYLTVHGILQTGHSASPGFLQLMSHASPLEINFSLIRILLVTTAMLNFFSLTYLIKRLQNVQISSNT
jgi:hypothetical protein